MIDRASLKSIKLAGRLDTARVGEIEAEFYTEVGTIKAETELVVVDLSEVVFLSSLGIRLLVTTGKTFMQRGLRFGLITPNSSDVMEALEISGLKGLFLFFADENEALAALQ